MTRQFRLSFRLWKKQVEDRLPCSKIGGEIYYYLAKLIKAWTFFEDSLVKRETYRREKREEMRARENGSENKNGFR